MKKVGVVHWQFVYKLVGKALDLWAEMKPEFDQFRKEQAEREPVELEAEEVDEDAE